MCMFLSWSKKTRASYPTKELIFELWFVRPEQRFTPFQLALMLKPQGVSEADAGFPVFQPCPEVDLHPLLEPG